MNAVIGMVALLFFVPVLCGLGYIIDRPQNGR